MTISRRLIRKFLILPSSKSFINRLVILLSRWKIYWPVAYLLFLFTRVLKKGTASKGPVKRVLILDAAKQGVLQDVEDIFRDDDIFELIAWPDLLRVTSAALLDPSIHHNNYVTTDPTIEASKEKYRNFLANVWRHYIAVSPVSAVLSVNFGYARQREFATAVDQEGIPFIVLQKENFNAVSPKRADFWRTIYREGRGKFTGSKILVYNDIERDLEISSGVVDAESIVVTGMARMDAIHRWRREHAGQPGADLQQPKVLFFTFSPDDKIPRINVEKNGYSVLPRTEGTAQYLKRQHSEWDNRNWKQVCAGTHEAIFEFARTRPDVQVNVKSKQGDAQAMNAKKLLSNDGITLPNLKIVVGGDPFKLLTESCVVVGFNSTALLEALAAGKPVIVPWFGEVRKKEMREIIPDLGSAVEYAESPKELIDLISKHVERQTKVPLNLPTDTSKALKRYVNNDDGLAAKRVLDAISTEIQDG